MRHNKLYRKLGRDSSHRKAMLNNLSKSLILNGKIDTTLERAKELQRKIEKMITASKVDTLHKRRLLFRELRSETLIKKLFSEIAPNYTERNGGCTRVVKIGSRKGDGAQMARIEFV